MKIRFSPGAQQQLQLISRINAPGTGFIFGSQIGKYTVIESLLPVAFNEANIAEVYRTVFEQIAEKLLGVFFLDETFFLCDWFIGDLLIKIRAKKSELYYYDHNKECIALHNL